MTPATRAAFDELLLRDPDLARIEAMAGPVPWRVRPLGLPGLLQAIVAQQISSQAASAIWSRLQALPGALEPAGLLELDEATLRLAGLSRPKVAHVRALAAAWVAGRLGEPMLSLLDDTAAIAAITSVRGLGPWTAEVYLLFAHGRHDVFPAGDVALAAAVADLKALPARPGPVAFRVLAEQWRPHRALAARLLWHHWRHITGRPAMDDPP